MMINHDYVMFTKLDHNDTYIQYIDMIYIYMYDKSTNDDWNDM